MKPFTIKHGNAIIVIKSEAHIQRLVRQGILNQRFAHELLLYVREKINEC